MKKNDVIYHYGYYRMASRLRLARYIALLVFLLFTLLLFVVFRQDMTLNHFRYLLRNFDPSPNSSALTGDTIYYNGETDASFGFVAGGLACVTDSRVFVTDRASGTTFSQYHGFTEPRAVFSEEYMLVYDRAGSAATVYNAFAALETFTYSGTVIGAAVADDGTFAVAVSEEGQYYSTVYVYDDDFEQVNKLSKYKYVTALALSDNGKYLALGSLYTGDTGSVSSEVLLMKVGEKKAIKTLDYEGESVFDISFFENGSFATLSDKALRFFDDEGSEKTAVSYQDAPPVSSYLGKENALLLYSSADARTLSVMAYSMSGKALWADAYTVKDRIRGFSEDEENLWLLFDSSALSVAKDKKSTEQIARPEDQPVGGCLVSDGKTVYIATSSSAKPITSWLATEAASE